MCRCCNSISGTRRYANELEPAATQNFDDTFERELSSVHQVKGKHFFLSYPFQLNISVERLHKTILEKCATSSRVPLCINPHSAAFKSFARYANHIEIVI